MSIQTVKKITGTGDVTTGKCVLHGLVNGVTAGSIVLRDGGAGGVTLVTLTVAASQVILFPTGVRFRTSLHATLTTVNDMSFMVGAQ